MDTQEIIDRAGRRLASAASSPARVILFGSHARGDARPDSDVDFLVIQRDVPSRLDETVRLRRAVGSVGVPVDVVVFSEAHVAEWGEVPSTMLHDALKEGRVLAQT